MWNIFKEYRHYILALFLILLPIIALNSGDKKPAEWYWFDRMALRITAPMQQLITWGVDSSWSVLQNYLFLLDIKQNNTILSQENRRLLNELSSFREIALQNERLKKLVEFSNAISGKKITAQVIARDLLPEFRTIRLNKGSSQGVRKGMAVVTHEGIVGRIIRVDNSFSDVLTLLDSSSAVDALIQRNRSRGVVEGLTENVLTMKYIRRTDTINVGDLVLSSGIGTLFPKGLIVGKVIKVRKKNFGITQTVEVTPSVDFTKLEEVTIIKPDASSKKIPQKNEGLEQAKK